jgi:uncharacterized membrane protein
MSQPILAISLFFHLAATAFWIGGLLIISVLVWPEARRVLEDQPALYTMLTRLRKRFLPLSNLALAVLLTTGMFQMTASPHYDGLLQFDNEWSRVMAAFGLLLQYGVVPALERASILAERGKGNPEEWGKLRRREQYLTWANLGLGLLILGFSAWAGSL